MTTDPTEVTIRAAEADDAGAIARVHVASWRSAYAGIMPTDYLESIDLAGREKTWHHTLTDTRSTVWIAETLGDTLGFASIGPSRDEDSDDGDLEVYTIYLNPESWGLGVGRMLMRTMLVAVPPGTPVSMWVFADATQARHFYRRHGFTPDGVERLEEFGDRSLTAIRLRHTDQTDPALRSHHPAS